MSESQYEEMVSLLTKATQQRKLSWKLDDDGSSFSTVLGDCSIRINSYMDFQMQAEIVNLMLLNANGEQFNSFAENSVIDPERFANLEVLYKEIRDSYYQIRESETTIMDKLRELTS